MNNKEVAKLIPVIQAFLEGKTIERKTRNWEFNKGWRDATQWEETEELKLRDTFVYRIKPEPEPKYRPFANAEECLKEMSKHTPFGLIKKNVSGAFYWIGSFDIKNIYIGTTQGMHSYADSLENFKFADGLPFGVKVEE